MEKEELKKALIAEKNKYTSKSFEELVKIQKPITYQGGIGDNWYQVEVQILEKTEKYVHLSISVDDGRIPKAILPLCEDFILYKDDKLES